MSELMCRSYLKRTCCTYKEGVDRLLYKKLCWNCEDNGAMEPMKYKKED